MALNYETLSWNIRISLKLINISSQKNHIKQLLEIIAALRGDRNHNRVATPFLWIKVEVSCKLSLGAVDVRTFLINLINRNNNLRISCLGKLNRLCGLRLHAIIRRDDNHNDICKHCTVLTNCRESLMTRSIEEGNLTILILHLISGDMLGNTTSLTFNRLLLEKRIKQSSLTVIDVTHHRYYRWTKFCILRKLALCTRQFCRILFAFKTNIRKTELFGHNLSRLNIEALINRRHNAILKKLTNQMCNRYAEGVR